MEQNESGRSRLLEQVLDLSRQLREEIPALGPQLVEIESRAEAPLRVSIAGKIKAGKSTLLNALIGARLAAADAAECTKVVTWYRHGDTLTVEGEGVDGATLSLQGAMGPNGFEIDLAGRTADAFSRLTLSAPLDPLRSMTMIDTPGTASISKDIAAKSLDFLTPDGEETTPTDAVIYLMRHVHKADVAFLHAFHDREFSAPSPVNCVGVLSRADEIAVGRADAMESARDIASTYSDDPRLRRLVQSVVPVSGLLAQASTTIDANDLKLLQSLASASDVDQTLALLSVSRFMATDALSEASEQRHRTLNRLSLYGVRNATTLLRSNPSIQLPQLQEALLRESGLDELQSLLTALFASRASVLKARSALLAIQNIAENQELPRAVTNELEKIQVSAHELTELRTLNLLRDNSYGLTNEFLADAERLLGGSGPSAATRLDTADDDPKALQAAALVELQRWRALGADPLAPRSVSTITDIVARTCEGIWAELAKG